MSAERPAPRQAPHLAPRPAPRPAAATGIRYAGIGDEAGVGLADQLAALDRLGWDAIELRTLDGIPVADLDDRAFDRLAEVLSLRGTAVVAVDARIGNWAGSIAGGFAPDLAELDVLARRCAVLGTRYVRVMSYPNAGLDDAEWERRVLARFAVLACRAQDAGLVLLHENCAGWAGADPRRTLRLLESVGSPALGVLFDTGNGLAYGYQAYPMLRVLLDHVRHVHVKDATRGRAGPVYTVPGAGEAGVAGCLRLLLAGGYRGSWSLEPHLSLRPHEATDRGRTGSDLAAGFVASGRALERLVRTEILPDFPAWRAAPGGLTREPAP